MEKQKLSFFCIGSIKLFSTFTRADRHTDLHLNSVQCWNKGLFFGTNYTGPPRPPPSRITLATNWNRFKLFMAALVLTNCKCSCQMDHTQFGNHSPNVLWTHPQSMVVHFHWHFTPLPTLIANKNHHHHQNQCCSFIVGWCSGGHKKSHLNAIVLMLR